MNEVTEMMICNNEAFTDCTWESYADSKEWTLEAGNGTKTAYVQFKDAEDNISSIYSDSIIVGPISNNKEGINFGQGSSFEEPLSFDGNNYTNESKPQLEGCNPHAEDGQIKIYTKNKNGSKKKIATIDIDSSGCWDYTFKKDDDGETTYYIKTFDSEGNETGSKSFDIIRDTEDPVFTTFPKAGTYQRGSKLIFTAEDATTEITRYEVKLTPKRNSWRRQKDDFYIIPESIPNGDYTFSVRVYDQAGNKTEKSINIQIADYIYTAPAVQGVETENQEQAITQEIPTQTVTPTQTPVVINTQPAEESTFRWWNPFSWF